MSVFFHSLQQKLQKYETFWVKGTKVQTFEISTLLCKFCRFLHRRCSIHAVFTSTCLSIFMSVCKSQSNGFVLANNVSQDGLWILMWLSWLDMALGLKNDRQSDISSWYAIIRCDELYRVQIPWTLVSQYYSWKNVAICIIEDADHVIFGLQYSAFVQDRVSSNLTRAFSSSKTELDKNRHSLSFAFIGPFFENFSPHKVEQSMMHKLSCMMVNCFEYYYYYTHALMNFLSIAKKMMAGSQLTSFFLIFNNEKVILRS